MEFHRSPPQPDPGGSTRHVPAGAARVRLGEYSGGEENCRNTPIRDPSVELSGNSQVGRPLERIAHREGAAADDLPGPGRPDAATGEGETQAFARERNRLHHDTAAEGGIVREEP